MPRRHFIPPPFTPDAARIAQRLSAAARAQNARAKPDATFAAICAQLRLVAQQIDNTVALLNSTDHQFCELCERGGVEPRDRAALLRSLDLLLNRQRILLRIPDPGALSPFERAPVIELQPAHQPRRIGGLADGPPPTARLIGPPPRPAQPENPQQAPTQADGPPTGPA